ncbi:hypothetical protein NSQ95_04065 [Psychrobacillus sp. FSL W7-1457]|uniref:hypothetical protein n=1 Tax=unclassified Psychrobacillus TaxID=2636677 RepID=UPI0030F8FD9B
MRNKGWKTATAVALLTSSVLAFSPIAYGKSFSVEQSVATVKSDLHKATTIYVSPALDGKLIPSDSLYTTLNSVKKNYEITKSVITSSKLSATEIEGTLKEMDAIYNEKVTKGLVSYIDAYNYATKYLEPLMREISQAEAKSDFAGVAAGYHKLSYQLKDRSSILYRFSGKAARDLLLEKYKKPADAKRDELMLPVTIYMKLVDLNSLYTAGKQAEALKVYAEINGLMEGLPKTSKYSPNLLAEVAKIKAIVEGLPNQSTEQQVLDAKVEGFVKAVNASQKNVLLSSSSSNSLTITVQEDISMLDFLSKGFYPTLISSLGVSKVNGNDPLSEAAMNELKALFPTDAKVLSDLKGKSFNLPVTVNNGTLDVVFTLVFN